MKACRTSIRDVRAMGLAGLIAANSLFDEVRCPAVAHLPTSFSIQDICAALTGRHEGLDVEGIRQELVQWNAIVAHLRPMELDDVKTMARLRVLDTLYQTYQSEKQSAQNVIRLDAGQKAVQSGGDHTDYARIGQLASEIRELLAKDDYETNPVTAEKIRELTSSVATSIQPKPLDVWARKEEAGRVVANKELLIAQINSVEATNQMMAIKNEALQLIQEDVSKMNRVLPADRRQVCALLDLTDPVQALPPQVEYLIENGNTIEAFVVSENRRNAKKKLA